AFIAWKALLLAAYTEGGLDERQRLDSTVQACLRHDASGLRPLVEDFVKALHGLAGRDVTPLVRMEWIADDRVPHADTEVDRVLRSIRRLERDLPQIEDSSLWQMTSELVGHMLRIRHVVIGHARVTTG